jgi:hypothetical protein
LSTFCAISLLTHPTLFHCFRKSGATFNFGQKKSFYFNILMGKMSRGVGFLQPHDAGGYLWHLMGGRLIGTSGKPPWLLINSSIQEFVASLVHRRHETFIVCGGPTLIFLDNGVAIDPPACVVSIRARAHRAPQ